MTENSLAEMRKANLALSKALGEMDLRASLQDILQFGHATMPGNFGNAHITRFCTISFVTCKFVVVSLR